jgi:hypothetical protein
MEQLGCKSYFYNRAGPERYTSGLAARHAWAKCNFPEEVAHGSQTQ